MQFDKLTPWSSRNWREAGEALSFLGMPWRVPCMVLWEGWANTSFARRTGAPVGCLVSCAFDGIRRSMFVKTELPIASWKSQLYARELNIQLAAPLLRDHILKPWLDVDDVRCLTCYKCVNFYVLCLDLAIWKNLSWLRTECEIFMLPYFK